MKIVRYVFDGTIKPVYNEEILAEYVDVLNRKKFDFDKATIEFMINRIRSNGINIDAITAEEEFIDKDDVVFFEVVLAHKKYEENTYLVTGNTRHFPKKSFVVTPSQFIGIVEEGGKN